MARHAQAWDDEGPDDFDESSGPIVEPSPEPEPDDLIHASTNDVTILSGLPGADERECRASGLLVSDDGTLHREALAARRRALWPALWLG